MEITRAFAEYFFGGTGSMISAAMLVLLIVADWRIFEKAGVAGWKSLIPIYNVYCLYKLATGSGLWLLWFLLPGIGTVIALVVLSVRLARAFGKGAFYTLGLLFLPNIFHLMLGWGSAQYRGPA